MRILLAVLLALGCGTVAGLQDDALRYEPPPVYEVWWQTAQECSGLDHTIYGMTLEDIRWWELPGDSFPCNTWPEQGCAGNVHVPDIYIASAWKESNLVITHEMLHVWIGDGGHNSPLWCECGLWWGSECE